MQESIAYGDLEINKRMVKRVSIINSYYRSHQLIEQFTLNNS